MINKLFCFDYGFIKFEDNFSKITVSNSGKSKFALFDEQLKVFEFDGHTSINQNSNFLPEAFGIFNEENKLIYAPVGEEKIKKAFNLTYPIKAVNGTSAPKPANDRFDDFSKSSDPVNDKFSAPASKPDFPGFSIQDESIISPVFDNSKNRSDHNTAEEFILPEIFSSCQRFIFALDNGIRQDELSALIPGSRWAQPQDEDYIIGMIFDEDEQPLYMCYCIESVWSEKSPKKFNGYCQWIPKNFSDPHNEGYWVIYINALTGERVK